MEYLKIFTSKLFVTIFCCYLFALTFFTSIPNDQQFDTVKDGQFVDLMKKSIKRRKNFPNSEKDKGNVTDGEKIAKLENTTNEVELHLETIFKKNFANVTNGKREWWYKRENFTFTKIQKLDPFFHVIFQ